MRIFVLLLVSLSSVIAFGQDGGVPLEAIDVPVVPELDLFAKIAAWVIAVNLLLSGLSAALAKIKDLTATDLDNRAYAIISKITGLLAKVVDFASANRPNTPKPKVVVVEEKKE